MLAVERYAALIKQYGLRRCLWHLAYGLRRKCGLLKRRTPAWAWRDRPLSSWVHVGVPSGHSQYRPFRESCDVRFFFPLGKAPRLRGQWASSALQEANDVSCGKFRYFSARQAMLGYPDVNWLTNPFTGKSQTADRHWSDVPVFDADRGDIKYIWEPSRFAWVYALARAYATGESEESAEVFWTLFESWLSANRPQMGPNWMCGQEMALRAMACVFALHVFWNSSATTDGRIASLVAFLAATAERIDANIGNALHQMSNHGASEAAGLYTIGLLFPELKGAERWRDRGRAILIDEARRYNWPDGSYVMHSVNYQRMACHVYLWCLRLAELNGDSFPPPVRDRLRRSYEFLYQLQDEGTGRVPNYGSNDGALILPINGCDFPDYRPVIGAMHYLFHHRRLYEDGPWSEDLLWLFGSEALDASVSRLSRSSKDLTCGGYFTMRGEQTWAMTRCYSYDVRPGQADLLHFDLWWKGVNVLRDSGSFSYYDPEGQWCRYFLSTQAHNTVVVGHTDQMIKGPRFRWFSLAKSRFLGHEQGDFEIWQGEHYGYRRLPSRATHRRTICRIGQAYWLIVDDVLGRGREDAELFWHFADMPYEVKDHLIRLKSEHGDISVFVAASGDLTRWQLAQGLDGPGRLGWQSRHYGERTPTPALCVEVQHDLPIRFITLVGLGELFDVITCDPGSQIAWNAEDGTLAGRVRLAGPAEDAKAIVDVAV